MNAKILSNQIMSMVYMPGACEKLCVPLMVADLNRLTINYHCVRHFG